MTSRSGTNIVFLASCVFERSPPSTISRFVMTQSNVQNTAAAIAMSNGLTTSRFLCRCQHLQQKSCVLDKLLFLQWTAVHSYAHHPLSYLVDRRVVAESLFKVSIRNTTCDHRPSELRHSPISRTAEGA